MKPLIFLSALTLSAGPLSAQELYGEFGGWVVLKFEDNCALQMQFEGPGETIFSLRLDADGDQLALIRNRNWSAKKGERYEVSYLLNGFKYEALAIGVSDSVYGSGFVSKLAPKFAADFAAGTSLYVYLGEQQIDELSLEGTAAAVAATRSCLEKVEKELAEAAKEKARFAHLPEDPFAKAVEQPDTVGGGTSRPASPGSGAWMNLVSVYPNRAQREGRQGTVGFSVTVGTNGRVTSCLVTESSGHADLDVAACRGMERFGRFDPALNSNGQPVEGEWFGTVTYTLD